MKIYAIISVVILGAVFGYVGWVFYSRWEQNRVLEQRAAAKVAAQRERDEAAFEGMGGNSFAILRFYTTPSSIRQGFESELCYGVSNAKTVSISPPVGDVWPAFSHCVSIRPSKTTTYTITITDAAGHTKSETTTLEVR